MLELVRGAACDTVNLRIHVLGLDPTQVHEQIERHGAELLPTLREGLSS